MSSSDFHFSSADGHPCSLGRARQSAKIREISEALQSAGLERLDEQAEGIGLSRSITWSILRGHHKNSGLSTATISRILATKKLPMPVRDKLLEYVEEKAKGLYGDAPIRIEQFKERLASVGISARRQPSSYFAHPDE